MRVPIPNSSFIIKDAPLIIILCPYTSPQCLGYLGFETLTNHTRVSSQHVSLETRYPSSTLLPFLFGGLLIKTEQQEKDTLIWGLLGNLGKGPSKIAGVVFHWRLGGYNKSDPSFREDTST